MEGFPWDDLSKVFRGCQRMVKVPNGAEIFLNFNRLSRVHQRYRRQTTERQTAYSECSEREREFTFAKTTL